MNLKSYQQAYWISKTILQTVRFNLRIKLFIKLNFVEVWVKFMFVVSLSHIPTVNLFINIISFELLILSRFTIEIRPLLPCINMFFYFYRSNLMLWMLISNNLVKKIKKCEFKNNKIFFNFVHLILEIKQLVAKIENNTDL